MLVRVSRAKPDGAADERNQSQLPKAPVASTSDTKELHGQARATRTDAGLEPAVEPAQLQLKQPADQLVELRQGETPTAGPPGAVVGAPSCSQDPVGEGMGQGMPGISVTSFTFRPCAAK